MTEVVEKVLLECNSAKELGEILVWSIENYYEEQGEDLDDDDLDDFDE